MRGLVFSAELEETFAEELAAQSHDIDDRQIALQHCLQKLRRRDRDLILHRYSGHGTLSEYADRTGRSIGGLRVDVAQVAQCAADMYRRTVAR